MGDLPFPMHNTISYLTSSATSQMTSNLLNDRYIFDNIKNVWKDPGILLPLFSDIAPKTSYYKNKIFKNEIETIEKNPKLKVKYVLGAHTELQSNGNLNVLASGFGNNTPFMRFFINKTWPLNSVFINNYQGMVLSLIIKH
jgi:hypothetical protein